MKIKLNRFVKSLHPQDPPMPDNGDFLTKGYSSLTMNPQHEMETDEHVDEMYGTDMGFCERNNYMDRY